MKHTNFFDTSALRAELAEALRLAKCWNREGGTQACRFLSTSWDFWDREELSAKWIAMRRSR
jgi:hypothetical protein